MLLTNGSMTSDSARAEIDTALLAEIFHLMGDGSRLGILLACLEGPVAVGALAAALGLSPSLVSHHLRLLRAARLVRAERRGKQVFYAVADDHVRHVLVDMVAHVAEIAPPPTGPWELG
jgi:ArsR family transcriptional regulator